jgi:hypothetical protein
VAEQVGMTVSGAWSRYRRTRPPKPSRLGRWQQVLADGLDKNVAIGVRAEGGLSPSLLADLMSQIRCDGISFQGFDSQRQKTWFVQSIPDPDDLT